MSKARTLKGAAPDGGFVHCPHCECGDWIVVARGIPDGPYVAALVCCDCETELLVEDGELRMPTRH